MKRRLKADMIVFFVIIPLILFGAFYISSKVNNGPPAYSVINNNKNGLSVFYKALKKLNYPAFRSLEKIYASDSGNYINIIPPGGTFDINNSGIRGWVSRGGTLIYLTEGSFYLPIYNAKPVKIKAMNIYRYNSGEVIVLDAADITNKALMDSTDTAYELLKEIEATNKEKIYFNEAYLYSNLKTTSLWDYIPLKVKFIIYQLILVLAAFFYYKGKRFGRPAVFEEESERTENEYLYSAASLYRHAKCWDLMLENYYAGFLKNFKDPHNWPLQWKQEGLPHQDKAEKLHAFMENENVKYKSKEYLQAVKLIEELANIIQKRRDSYWKQLEKI